MGSTIGMNIASPATRPGAPSASPLGAPDTSQADFDDAVKQSVYELFYSSVSFDGDFAENLEGAFARDVEDALKFNADNGGDDMSTYYGRGHESSRSAHRRMRRKTVSSNRRRF